MTEVEAIEDLDGSDEECDRFDVGYGLYFAHNERKAIAMANLELSVELDVGRTALEHGLRYVHELFLGSATSSDRAAR